MEPRGEGVISCLLCWCGLKGDPRTFIINIYTLHKSVIASVNNLVGFSCSSLSSSSAAAAAYIFFLLLSPHLMYKYVFFVCLIMILFFCLFKYYRLH